MTCKISYHKAVRKTPDESRAIDIDWSDELEATDVISLAVWAGEPPMKVGTETIAGQVTSCVVSAGECRNAYNLGCTITLASGVILERTVLVPCRAGTA